MDSLPESKVCSKCGVDKPVAEFSLRKSTNSLLPECKSCSVERYREWYIKNKTRAINTASKWKKDNPEKVKESSRKRYEKKADHINAINKEWKKNNPDKRSMHKRKRRALISQVESHPYSEKDVLYKWGNLCHICGNEIDLSAPRSAKYIEWEFGLHLDHVVPLAAGGSDMLDNVKPAHAICNLRKGAKPL